MRTRQVRRSGQLMLGQKPPEHPAAARLMTQADRCWNAAVKAHTMPWSSGAVDAYASLLRQYQAIMTLLAWVDRNEVERALVECRETAQQVEVRQNLLFDSAERAGWTPALEEKCWQESRRLLRLLDQEKALENALSRGA